MREVHFGNKFIVCRHKTRKNKYPNIKFEVVSENLPLESHIFDFVSMFEVMEHVVDTQGILEDIHSALKPEGYSDNHNRLNWPKKVLIVYFCWKKYFYPINPHIRFFTKNINGLLLFMGFDFIAHACNGDCFKVMPKG